MKSKLFNIEELEPDELDDEDNSELENLVSEEEIKNQLNVLPASKLADIVVTGRYIGLYKNLAQDVMEELVKRRQAGDTFQYEEYIENNLKDLPKIDFTFPNISSILDQLKKFTK